MIIAVSPVDLQSRPGKQPLKVFVPEEPDTFSKEIRTSPVLKVNSFNDASSFYLFIDLEADAVDVLRFCACQVVDDVLRVKKVEYEDASRFKAFCDIAERFQVVLLRVEITKAGKKVKDIIKVVDPKQMPHVMRIKRKSRVFEPAGVLDAARREVYSGNLKSLVGQVAGVPSFSAGEVEHAGFRRRL